MNSCLRRKGRKRCENQRNHVLRAWGYGGPCPRPPARYLLGELAARGGHHRWQQFCQTDTFPITHVARRTSRRRPNSFGFKWLSDGVSLLNLHSVPSLMFLQIRASIMFTNMSRINYFTGLRLYMVNFWFVPLTTSYTRL